MNKIGVRSLTGILGCILALVLTMSLPAAEAGEVAAVNADEIKSIISENKGKVVVLNFWATWCPPCIKEFPDIIKLYDQYESKGLQVIAISMNEPDELEDIAEFLGKHNPRFPVYRAASTEEEFYSEFEEQWWGEMPMTMIYDKAGNVAMMHKKALSFEEFEQDVSSLLSAN
ncbi:MAG TPA: redoxin family protein [Gammaproteobacteria bacterium]|nr:redoxin family protein [Gammaproteobacteria bacterium]